MRVLSSLTAYEYSWSSSSIDPPGSSPSVWGSVVSSSVTSSVCVSVKSTVAKTDTGTEL